MCLEKKKYTLLFRGCSRHSATFVAYRPAEMRLSLSKKEVAEIHLMLTTLPIPPIPVAISMDYEHLEDTELKAAFEMATLSLVKDSLSDDGIGNSLSIFAALSFFVKWSASTGVDPVKKHQDMQHKKDASLLRIISNVLDYNDTVGKCQPQNKKDDDILQLFITASQEWINTYLPDNITIKINAAPNNKTIGFEHDLHIAMAHYCYSQGVLYNSKNSNLMCKVHDRLYNTFLEEQKCTKEEDVIKEAVDGVVNTASTHEHMEIAALYSQFPYHKMMLLCFDRLLQDCLYGHKTPDSSGNVQQNARDLLKMSFANYESMTSKTASLASSKITSSSPVSETECVDCTLVEIPVKIDENTAAAKVELKTLLKPSHTSESQQISSLPDQMSNLVPIEEVAKTPESMPPIANSTAHGCVADMGSYKSCIGIFILGMVNYLQKDDPYSLQNMSTSLRHLLELMVHGNAKARLACELINIPQLFKLVRSNVEGLGRGGTLDDIEATLLEIEKTHCARNDKEVASITQAL